MPASLFEAQRSFALVSQVRAVVEEHRLAMGLGRHQVLVNTDLLVATSGTLKSHVRTRYDFEPI